jgi:hypothetical protein
MLGLLRPLGSVRRPLYLTYGHPVFCMFGLYVEICFEIRLSSIRRCWYLYCCLMASIRFCYRISTNVVMGKQILVEHSSE